MKGQSDVRYACIFNYLTKHQVFLALTHTTLAWKWMPIYMYANYSDIICVLFDVISAVRSGDWKERMK
jgi:hypothetical protein